VAVIGLFGSAADRRTAAERGNTGNRTQHPAFGVVCQRALGIIRCVLGRRAHGPQKYRSGATASSVGGRLYGVHPRRCHSSGLINR
jgi:hypothetical protein